MTILPGQPIAPPDAATPAPPEPPRGPRVSLGGRTLAVLVAAVAAAGGGGAWLLLHSSGGTAPAAVVHPAATVHHKAKPTALPAPRTKAEAMRAATKIFAVLPAQLPGWQVDGKPTFDTGGGNDAVAKSVNRCLTAANSGGLGVNSPEVFHRTATPTYLAVDASINFVRTAAQAAQDLAVLGRASVQNCLRRTTVGRTIAIDRTASMRFTSMRTPRVAAGVVAFQFDGQIESAAIGGQSVRVVMLATADRTNEILVTSSGLGAALPVSADLRVLKAIVAQSRRVVG
jgi:hypothetical protein